MKVLSIKEPFATLIKDKVKHVETRSWKTNYRGEIYIHASLGMSKISDEVKELIKDKNLQPGYIMCKCKLIDCVYMSKEYIEDMKLNHYTEYICGTYQEGRYGWLLSDIEVLKVPIKAKGRLGIWNYN